MPDSDPTDFVMRDLGRLAYAEALVVQRRVHQRVLDGQDPQTLLLVEHDPVITVSQRRDCPQHLLATPQRLAELGIDVQPTDRGGDVTYHGPGQLVVYPIIRLTPLGLNVGRYVRLLEDVVMDTVSAFGVAACRDQCARGVWVGDAAGGVQPPAANEMKKLCAVGVRVQRGVTLHGLALNVTTDLDHFQTIVPCGLSGRGVTSLERLLGRDAPSMERVKTQLVESMRRKLSETIGRATPACVT